MKQHKKITISFLPHDSELWDYIEKKKERCNLSEYIRSLIRKEMVEIPCSEDRNIAKILELLLLQQSAITTDFQKTLVETPVNEEFINTIDSLF